MEPGGAQYERCAGLDGAVDGRKGARDGRCMRVDGAVGGRGEASEMLLGKNAGS